MNKPVSFSDKTFPELTVTEIIQLKSLQPGDDTALLKMHSDPAVTHFIGGEKLSDIEGSRKYIQRHNKEFQSNTSIYWGINDPKGLIGIILLKDFDYTHCFCTVGYVLSKSHWGKGIRFCFAQISGSVCFQYT